MRYFYILAFVLGVTTLLPGCATAPRVPKMVSFTTDKVVVDYSFNNLSEATNLAQQFCSAADKDAEYVRSDKNKHGKNLGHFVCVTTKKN